MKRKPVEPLPAPRLDRLTPEQRSWNMSRVRGAHTRPELAVRRILTSMGLRYRLHRKDLPGKPDVTFGPRRTVLFVHGCFWHMHPGCKSARLPKGNHDFWRNKLEGNAARDIRHRADLRKLGWRVIIVWECELKNPVKLGRRLRRLLPPLSE